MTHQDVIDIEKLVSNYRWIEPQPANPVTTENVLTEAQVQQWKVNGYCLVDGVYPPELVDEARRELQAAFRPPTSVIDGEELSKEQDFGSNDVLEFPSRTLPACNQIPFHPRALKAVTQLLDINADEIRLIQAVPWAKYGATKIRDCNFNQDQRIHCDYPNNTLVTPPSWHHPEAVTAILYYGDVSESMGPTALVSRVGDEDVAYIDYLHHNSAVAGKTFMNNRMDHEKYLQEQFPESYNFRQLLYVREAKARFKQGTLLLYRHDVWHRGTPVIPGTVRYAHNLAWKRSDVEWLTNWNTGWAKHMYDHPPYTMYFESWMAMASVAERTCLGFPKPGHPYWTRDTLASVKKRYGAWGFDITPYQLAFTTRETKASSQIKENEISACTP